MHALGQKRNKHSWASVKLALSEQAIAIKTTHGFCAYFMLICAQHPIFYACSVKPRNRKKMGCF